MNLGYLAQALVPGLSGYLKGQATAEQTAYQRQRDQRKDQREQELFDLQKQKAEADLANLPAEQRRLDLENQARALSLLPDFAQAPESLGPSTPTAMDQAKLDSERALAELRRAQTKRALQPARPAAAADPHKGALAKAQRLAQGTAGNQAEFYRAVNADPELFGMLQHRQLDPAELEAAYQQATMAAQKGQATIDATVARTAKTNGTGVPDVGAGLAPRFRKFPSESVEAWVRRMKRMGVPPDQVLRYGQQQGLDSAVVSPEEQ